MPAVKEPSGLITQDSKPPDGLIVIPWHGGKWQSLVWDVTVVSTLARSYVDRTATGVGVVQKRKLSERLRNMAILSPDCIFQSVAVGNLGPRVSEISSSQSLEFRGKFRCRMSSLFEEEDACYLLCLLRFDALIWCFYTTATLATFRSSFQLFCHSSLSFLISLLQIQIEFLDKRILQLYSYSVWIKGCARL